MKIIQFVIKPNGHFPNNPALPVLLYKDAFRLPEEEGEELVREVFHQNNWSNDWVNGIFDYHHYHSNTHEVLGVIRGSCTVLLGGDKGIKHLIERGDALLLPAGIAHRNLGATEDFSVMGAYPEGRDYDMRYGKPEEYEQALENISKAPIPSTDPLYGYKGPVLDYWKAELQKTK